MRRLLFLVLLLALLPGPAAAQLPDFLGGGASEYDEKLAREMEPAPLAFPPRPRQRPSRVLRFHVWADQDFRGVTPGWKIKTRAWLSQLSRLIEPALGVTFEVASFHNWDRPATHGTVHQALDELAKAEARSDDDWVVGLISALPLVTTDIHSLGAARPGRHLFVLRAMGDMNDARAVYANLGKIDPARKEALYSRRIQHKELAIFLHEWGHTLGVSHVANIQDIMCPTYAPSMRSFSPKQLEALERALDRTAGGSAAAAPAHEPEERPGAPGPDAAVAHQSAATAVIAARLEKARAVYQEGDRAGASDRLDELVDFIGTVAAPGDPAWLTAAEACVTMGNLRAAGEALASAGDSPAATRLRARLAELRRPRGKPARR